MLAAMLTLGEVQALRDLLRERVALALVFGSVARGEDHQQSDLDIGFMPLDAEAWTFGAECALQAELACVAGREVDLVRLDVEDVVLRFRAARDGVLLWEQEPGDADRFRIRAGIDHADLRWNLEAGQRRLLARLAST